MGGLAGFLDGARLFAPVGELGAGLWPLEIVGRWQIFSRGMVPNDLKGADEVVVVVM